MRLAGCVSRGGGTQHAKPLASPETVLPWSPSCRYPIEELAAEGDFIDSTFLLLHGELPSKQEKQLFEREIKYHTLVGHRTPALVLLPPLLRRRLKLFLAPTVWEAVCEKALTKHPGCQPAGARWAGSAHHQMRANVALPSSPSPSGTFTCPLTCRLDRLSQQPAARTAP